MGERGRRLPPLQQPEGGPAPPRGRLPPAARAPGAQGDALDRDRRRPHRTWLGAVPGPGGRRRPRLPLTRPSRASLAAFARRIAPWALPLLAGALGAVLAVTFLARQEVTVGPARVRLEAGPALVGSSRLAAPPFGSVSARTHLGPLRFRATIDDIDVKALGQLLAGSPGPPEGAGGPQGGAPEGKAA